MKPFIFSCIAPHGGEIIPALAGKHTRRMEKTRFSMNILGERMKEALPDVIVVITPHGTRIDGIFSIANSETMAGEFSENNRTYVMKREVDRELATLIAAKGREESLPIGLLNYGTSAGPLSNLPLDWGSIVPLSFMPDVPIVVITPSRSIPYKQHIQLGNVIREVALEYGKRVGLVASCDWSHTHDTKGPYGFHPSAKRVDDLIINIIKSNNLEDLMKLSEKDIDNAKPDGIWQTLILAGAIPKEQRHVEFLSYEAPTYFGLLCAAY